ncbi:hypothetical protein EJP82_21300 [Paenibacillus anaericanus]|uniref:Zinc ribbon domain-containing protein n=1 Tax=Paenibacillus anaericanus TaxID=170367 RepID=A0A433Y4J1_9BACL|nr:zinc ribbon domain-containing protein [Paenibacillus anaericanus]RUT43016.1 hypothetical protein EJP82_21300 [Paenibacillus anaericanus]
MNCPQCNQVNEKGKFCVACGTPLHATPTAESPTYSETATSSDSPGNTATFTSASTTATSTDQLHIPALPNVANGWDKVRQSDAAKKSIHVSKQYGSYFLKALLHPFQTTQSVNSTHFTNGIITMFFTSFLLPFIFYVGAKQAYGFSISFGSTVIKPLFLIWISLLLASLLALFVIRLGRVASDYLTVTAKLGTMLVPAVAALFLCMICTLLGLGTKLPVLLLLIGISVIFTSISAVILNAGKESTSGLDPLYGAVIANLIYAYTLFKIVSLSMEAILDNLFGGFNMFY